MPISWKQLKIKHVIDQICDDFDKEVVKLPVQKILNTGVCVSCSFYDEIIEEVKQELEKIFTPLGWSFIIRPSGLEPLPPLWGICFMPVEI